MPATASALRPRSFALLVACASALAGCEVTATQLLVFVDSDLDPGPEIDGFEVGVRGPDGRAVAVPQDVFSLHDVRLPASFGVAPRDGDPERSVEVEVGARLSGDVLFRTRAHTSYLEDERARLDLFLARRCRTEAVACELVGLTCDGSGCRDPEVDLEDAGDDSPRDPSPAEWAVVFGSDPGADPLLFDDWFRVALDSRSNAIVAGTYQGFVQIDDARFTADETGGFVVAVPPDGGAPVWQAAVGATNGWVRLRGVAVDPATDRTIVVGSFTGTLELGTDRVAAIGDGDGFLVVFDAQGNPVDHETFGFQYADVQPEDVVVGPNGDAFIAGWFGYDVSFGDTLHLTYPDDHMNLFLARWNGDFRWACGTKDRNVTGVALAADGTLRVTGVTDMLGPDPAGVRYVETVVVGGGLECEGTDFHSLGGAAGSGPRVEVGPDGRAIWAGGLLHGVLDEGTELVGQFGEGDGLVVSFDPDADFQWRRYLGNADSPDDLHDLVVNRYGTSFVAGSVSGASQVEPMEAFLPWAGDMDGVAAAFAADGTPLWARTFGGEGREHLSGIAYDEKTGAVIVVGFGIGLPETRVFGSQRQVPDGFVVYRFIP